MKKQIKLFGIILVSAFCLSALSACGGGSGGSDTLDWKSPSILSADESAEDNNGGTPEDEPSKPAQPAEPPVLLGEAAEGDWEYDFYSDKSAVITAYLGSASAVDVPAELGGYQVTALGTAFYEAEHITSVTIPDGVTKIGTCCFLKCTALSQIVIPDSVVEIDNYAFNGTPWYESQTGEFVVIGGGVLIKYNGAGGDVTIPGGVVAIASDAMQSVDTLTSIHLPEGLKIIGNNVFQYADSLAEVVFPEGLMTIGDYAFKGCTALRSVRLPESLEYIGKDAFSYSGLEELTLPDDVGRIGLYAFNSTPWLDAMIAEHAASQTDLPVALRDPFLLLAGGRYAVYCPEVFYYSPEPTLVVVPDGVRTADLDGAWPSCLVVPEGVVSFGMYNYSGAKLELHLPDSVDDIQTAWREDYKPDVTICCGAGSAAEAYAQKLGLATAAEYEGGELAYTRWQCIGAHINGTEFDDAKVAELQGVLELWNGGGCVSTSVNYLEFTWAGSGNELAFTDSDGSVQSAVFDSAADTITLSDSRNGMTLEFSRVG